MPVTDLSPNRTQEQHTTLIQSPDALVDTNALLQKAIQQLPPEVRNGMVLRCDELPRLRVNEETIEETFMQLLQMIVAERTAGAKLYLYITCSPENKKEKEAILSGPERFFIQFHTNINPHETWMRKAEHNINSIASLLLPFGGSLLVNKLKNSGCVFCISLPGK